MLSIPRLLAGRLVALALATASLLAAASGEPCFPGAVGFGTETPAGRGGRIIKVTTLTPTGPGSLTEAVQARGPRIVVFEVGGIIDLGAKVLKLNQPFLTIAGQTAPSPGITLVRGGVLISTHDVLIQHLRVRAGDAGRPKKSGWEVDSMSTVAAYNIVVDHCSLAWSTDENLSASGPRFDGGDTPDAWRQHTSHDITFSRCIIAEGLSHASHTKDEHSKGSLIHDNARRVSILGNLYASNVERNPLFKGGVQGVIVNNLIDNPGSKAIHYGLVASEWTGRPYVDGEMAAVGNVLQYGPNTKAGMALVTVSGAGPLQLFLEDNLTRDLAGAPVAPHAIAQSKTTPTTATIKTIAAPTVWPDNLKPLPAAKVYESVLLNAGARPWDRDEIDQRIVAQVKQHKGRIIDSQDQVGGYPTSTPTTRKLTVPADHIHEWLASFR